MTDAGWPSPLWAAPFLGQVIWGCERKLAKYKCSKRNKNPETDIGVQAEDQKIKAATTGEL